jgi:tRNA nucleotidyltransferase (CCA-adding enzyme)
LGSAGRRDLLALALASRAVAHAALTELIDELSFEAVQRDAILSAAAGADGLAASLRLARRPSEIAAAVADSRPEAVALAGALGPDAQAREWLDELRHVRLEIDGSDLLGAGIVQGPAVGAGLRAALAAELDERGLGRERQLEAALRAAQALES